jgi:hypothetical protein
MPVTEAIPTLGIARLEMRYYVPRALPLAGLGVVLGVLEVIHLHTIVPALSGGQPRWLNIWPQLLHPVVWVSVYLSYLSIAREYRLGRVQDLAVTAMSARQFFLGKFQALFVVLMLLSYFAGALRTVILTVVEQRSPGGWYWESIILGLVECFSESLYIAGAAPVVTWSFMIFTRTRGPGIWTIILPAVILGILGALAYNVSRHAWMYLTLRYNWSTTLNDQSWVAAHRDILAYHSISLALIAIVVLPLSLIPMRRFHKIWFDV